MKKDNLNSNKMKIKIQEVLDYFKKKLLSNDFTITFIEECTLELLIDNEYRFIIWTGNIDIPKSRKVYSFGGKLSFMDVNLTDDESIKLDSILSPTINKFRRETLLKRKMEELEKLQKEVNSKI